MCVLIKSRVTLYRRKTFCGILSNLFTCWSNENDVSQPFCWWWYTLPSLSTPPYPLLKVSSTATLEGKGQLRFTVGKWSPHHNCSQLATANDTAIRGWDLRTMRWAMASKTKPLIMDGFHSTKTPPRPHQGQTLFTFYSLVILTAKPEFATLRFWHRHYF